MGELDGQNLALKLQQALEPQRLLQQQLQVALAEISGLEVRSRYAMPIQTVPTQTIPTQASSSHNRPAGTSSRLVPSLTVLSSSVLSSPVLSNPVTAPSKIHWVIDINPEHGHRALRAQQFSQLGIAEYWSLDTQQVTLRTYQRPTANGYQHHQLFHVGDSVSPAAFSHLIFQLQEPLPLYFLTRTVTGQRAHLYTRFPLRLLNTDLDDAQPSPSSTRNRTDSP
ncbi:MAG: hypothetical protein ACFB16_01560 [Phormidesmis sp.]